jgi:hypothetical protein
MHSGILELDRDDTFEASSEVRARESSKSLEDESRFTKTHSVLAYALKIVSALGVLVILAAMIVILCPPAQRPYFGSALLLFYALSIGEVAWFRRARLRKQKPVVERARERIEMPLDTRRVVTRSP